MHKIVLPRLGMPKAEVAGHLSISRQTPSDMIGEKQPVTPNMAVCLGELRGWRLSLWLNIQALPARTGR